MGIKIRPALIALLERIHGRAIVRFTAGSVIPVYAAFLLASWPLVKAGLALLVRLGCREGRLAGRHGSVVVPPALPEVVRTAARSCAGMIK